MKKLFVFLETILTAGIYFGFCSPKTDLVIQNEFIRDSKNTSLEQEEAQKEKEGFLIQEELKVQDVQSTVVYVERPVYVPEAKDSPSDYKKKTGSEAVTESQKKATQKPEHYKDGMFFYQFDEHFVYEVYAQPYHLTDIILEPGEVVIGTPLLSEDDSVWELTAGVAKDEEGYDVQHLFVKPAYNKLDSSLVIITDRRVYHFRLKSFQDVHMAMVKFTYPLTKNVWAKKKEDREGFSIVNDYIRTTDAALLSFDYSIKYSKHKVPEFLPTCVYDDGQCTYIQLDEKVLQKKLPGLFNEKNEIINYSVHENVLVIPRLINKATLRLGKEKVTIEKKITKTKEKTGE